MSSLEQATPKLRNRLSGITLGVLAELSQVFLLILSMWLIVRAAEQPPILFLTFAIVGVRAFALGRAALRYLERLSSHNVILGQLAVLRSWSFEKLIPLTPVGIADKSRGEILSRLVDDLDELQNETLRFKNPVVVSLISTFFSLVVVALLSPVSAAIIGGSIIVFGGLGALLTSYVTVPLTAKQAELKGALSEAILNRLDNGIELKIYGALESQNKRISELQARLIKQQLRSAALNGVVAAITMFGAGIVTLFLLHLASATSFAGVDGLAVSAPVVAAIVMAPAAIYELMNVIPLAIQTRALVRESALRVDDLVTGELPTEIPVEGSAGGQDVKISESLTGLLLEGVSAKYPATESPAVAGINFAVAPGDLLVIRGDSGSGKSTIARLLVRFLEYSGSIQLNGVQLRDLPVSVIRSKIGLSEQRPHIFEGTLRDNLILADLSANDDRLQEVLNQVGLRAWADCRQGLDTQLGVMGSLVSGGQAQRIALARVLLADFDVVIFDEPTSQLDPLTAQKVLNEMLNTVSGKIVILITHDKNLSLPESAKYLSL